MVRVGDAIPSVGVVTSIRYVFVNEYGHWLVEVGTDNPLVHTVVLTIAGVWSKVGDPVPSPSGATVRGFDAWTQDLFGYFLWDVNLANTPGGSADDEAIYWGFPGTPGTLIQLQKGDPTSNLTDSYAPGTTWDGFGDVQFSKLAGGFLVRGTLADPSVPGPDESFAAVAYHAGTIGACCSISPIAEEGGVAPDLTETIEEVRSGPWDGRITSAGNHVYWSCDISGPSASDGCVYRTSTFNLQHLLLAREGSPAPVSGRTWGPLENISLDANVNNSWTLRAQLDSSDVASDEILLLDGAKLVQEGDSHPVAAPYVIDGLGRGRAILRDDGLVLWYAHWNGPPGASEALILGDQSLVRAGATQVGGVPLATIASGPSSYAMAPVGQFAIFHGMLADGTEGAFLVELGGMQTYCTAKVNSQSCIPWISWLGSPPSASHGAGFVLQGRSILSQISGLCFYGTSGPLGAPFHGGTLCVQPPLRRMLPLLNSGGLGPPGSNCTGTLSVDFGAWIASGADPALVAGQDVFAQFWYRDPGFQAPNDVGLTDAITFFVLP